MSPPREATKKSTSKSPVQPNADVPKAIEPEQKQEEQLKKESANTEPLAPPPRPAAVANTPDYFSGVHNLSNETNPFEFSFGGNAGPSTGGLQTPGGTKLPSVAALTSPAIPHYWGSTAGLRSGPLSPAMLTGPAKDDYFGDSYNLHRVGQGPRPQESDMRSATTPGDRTGLTPGGGGSMFPEPSPGGSGIFNSLTAGGATPGTLDFHRTAMNINARKMSEAAQLAKITSQPQDVVMNGLDVKPPQFRQHENETNDAANGLFLLANAHNGPQQTSHYAIAPQSTVHAQPMPMGMGGQSQETSPHIGHRNGGSISTNSGRGQSEVSEDDQSRPLTRNKNKRNSTQDNQTNGRRKASDQPKTPANKKSKANNGMSMSMEPPSEDEEPDMSKDEFNANGKKMTDEEKRKNFLERNRVAALKCRQRKKQWLANLQQKVEMYSVENDNLNATIAQLRDEMVNLKTLLLAHKDCPVAHTQGLNNVVMQQAVESYGNPHMNPYGMAMNQQHQQQQQMMASQGYARRES
ncbi:bZIP transcription factor [Leptodontidium sp. MPI-SDFR-AT-0119]|nr:bZIP transcription factor [Leptodontidium sp. MPI-SDFR-AT-0119]